MVLPSSPHSPGRVAAALAFTLALALTLALAVAGRSAGATVGGRLWVSRFHTPHVDQASDVAVNPNGSLVYVAGTSYRPGAYEDWVTLGLDPATGARVWTSRYDGPGHASDEANALAVGPDGARVYVAGTSYATSWNYTLIACGAASGAQLWVARGLPGAAEDVAVAPDGATVFVSGTGFGTAAYDASSGAKIWSRRYQPAGTTDGWANAVALSPDGTHVFVTGYSHAQASGDDYATVAYDAATGAAIWARRYDGPGNGTDRAAALAVSPDGAGVYVTGTSDGAGSDPDSAADWATIEYSAATGAAIWSRRYDGPDHLADAASALAVSPDGSRLYVAGSRETAAGTDAATIAYDGATGATMWRRRYDGTAHLNDAARRLAVSPDGSTVFVAGSSEGAATSADYLTIAYRAGAGTRLWARRYDGPGHSADQTSGVAVSPDGRRVLVTGGSFGAGTQADYATLAYGTS